MLYTIVWNKRAIFAAENIELYRIQSVLSLVSRYNIDSDFIGAAYFEEDNIVIPL